MIFAKINSKKESFTKGHPDDENTKVYLALYQF